MKRPRRERQHAWREHFRQRKLVRRMERIYDLRWVSAVEADAIAERATRLENELFAHPRLKRLMGRA